MNLLYIGSFFPESRTNEIISNSKGTIQNAGNTYQNALLKGFSFHFENIDILTSPMIGSFPFRYKKIYFKGSTFSYNKSNYTKCIPFNNISLYKILSRSINIKKEIIKWLKLNQKNRTLIVYSLDLSYLKAVFEVKKKYPEVDVCLIVTDLIKHMVYPKSPLTSFFINYSDKITNKYLESINKFVLITEQMKDEINVGKRPYIVVEGIYNKDNLIENTTNKMPGKNILYTGTLAKQFGILHLLKAFSGIKNEEYNLLICGEGDAKSEILQLAKLDSRIKYLGQLKREEVLILQKSATVLVNPRLSSDEYTKFSFSSKTMEYLASGTPTIMHPLQGIPSEYHNYIIFVEDETDEGLRNAIINACEMENEILNSFGEKAKNFILNNKDHINQTKKIVDLIVNKKI